MNAIPDEVPSVLALLADALLVMDSWFVYGEEASDAMFSFRYLGCQSCDSLAQGEACHFSDLRLRAVCSIRRMRELADCTERWTNRYIRSRL